MNPQCAEPLDESAPPLFRGRRNPPSRRGLHCFRPFERRGATAVEFAIIAPLFILLVLGVIEFGRGMMVKQIITNAAREGARRAIIENVTEAEVKQVVNAYLTGASVGGATVTVTPATLNTLGLGDPVTVQVSVPFNSVSWSPAPWFLKGRTLSESTTMRAERLQ
jgi:Flp pilus assembly protein TadG